MTLNEDDTFTALGCMMRYAMGRMTYVVDDACRIIQANFLELTGHHQEIMYRDLHEEMARLENAGKLMGHQCDHERWSRLHVFMHDNRCFD